MVDVNSSQHAPGTAPTVAGDDPLVAAQHALMKIDQLLTVAANQLREEETDVACTLIEVATDIAVKVFEADEQARRPA